MDLAKERERALEFIERNRVHPWVDERAIEFVARIRRREPRADLPIDFLPFLATPSPTDLIPVFHNGETYAAYLSSQAPQRGQTLVAVDGSVATQIGFSPAFSAPPTYVGVQVLNNPQTNAWAISAQVDPASITESTANIWVVGGPAGKSVTVAWFAIL